MPIVKTLIFLGKQNIPLRGHRDDGPISNENYPNMNDGNFRRLPRFRVDSGDEVLENHLKTSTSRATYISKTIQDKIIDCYGMEIVNKILKRVHESGFYAVIFDETPDTAGKAPGINEIIVTISFHGIDRRIDIQSTVYLWFLE